MIARPEREKGDRRDQKKVEKRATKKKRKVKVRQSGRVRPQEPRPGVIQ